MNAQQPARRFHALRLTTLAFMLQQLWLPAYAVPDQSPLVNRPEGKPLPNLMLTLDESGSMTQQYLPEGDFTVNGRLVNLGTTGGQFVFGHPAELEKNRYTQDKYRDSRFFTAVPLALESVQLTDRTRLLQYQIRSPQLNTIYYNPAIQYKPWQGFRADGALKPFLDANPNAANLDPLALDPNAAANYPSGWVDLTNKPTVNLTTTTSYTAAWHGAGTSKKDFNPALLYLLRDGGDPTDPNSFIYYDLTREGETFYPWAFPGRTDCAVKKTNEADRGKQVPGTTICSQAAEQANFANWFVYYRSRLLIAQGAFPDSLNPLGNQFRIGWGGLHSGIVYTNGIPSSTDNATGTYTVDEKPSSTVQHGVREWTTDTKQELTKWMRVLKTYAYTPTRQAVLSVRDYFMREDKYSPWASNMKTGTEGVGNHLSCRRSYNMVLTDGYYNSAVPAALTKGKNLLDDSKGSSSIDGLTYPFMDASTNTLADYVMDSWLTDLQPRIPNDVTPRTLPPQGTSADDAALAKIKSDPATHQHLNYFFMGFGIMGNLLSQDVLKSSTEYDKELLRLAKCDGTGTNTTNAHCWKKFDPDNSANQADIIDDIWHAALNSRGQYFNVSDPDDLKEALAAIVNRSSNDAFREGGVATASPSLTAGNIKFVPQYTPYTWTGTVKANRLDANGQVTSELWSAESNVPAPSERNIYADKDGSAVTLANSGLDEALIGFLRGDASKGTLRQSDKNHPLPDFINSIPLYVKEGRNLGFSDNNYATYRDKLKQREGGLLLVGGNGGMLHAFNVTTGKEAFAYIPSGALPKLPLIAQKNYGFPDNPHQYVVDGQLTESDVLLGTNWTNIVVGTMGAGGRSIFALQLDASNPLNNLDNKSVLWDKTSDDVGYITSTPQIGRLPTGEFRIFAGNGVDSPNGKVALLAIDPSNGEITAIDVGSSGAGPESGTKAGLGGVTLVTDSKTGFVTTIYAGDTLGRLWRFDVDSKGNITVGFQGQTSEGHPLFTANDSDQKGVAQPILAAPLVYTHPLGGQLVAFNTGRLLYTSDSENTQLQSAYGIWDKVPSTRSSISDAAPDISRTDLQHQTINKRVEIAQVDANDKPILASDGTTAVTATFFELSSNAVTWADSTDSTSTTTTNASAKLGWVLDLAIPDTTLTDSTLSHPKAIYDPRRFGNSMLISAISSGDKGESCTNSKAKGYAFLVKALSGGQQTILPAIDTDGNGRFTDKDQLMGGFTTSGGAGNTLTGAQETVQPNKTGPTSECTKGAGLYPGEGENIQDCDPVKQGKYRVKDRIWRQLLNPPHP